MKNFNKNCKNFRFGSFEEQKVRAIAFDFFQPNTHSEGHDGVLQSVRLLKEFLEILFF